MLNLGHNDDDVNDDADDNDDDDADNDYDDDGDDQCVLILSVLHMRNSTHEWELVLLFSFDGPNLNF